jgi:hypothetical protein
MRNFTVALGLSMHWQPITEMLTMQRFILAGLALGLSSAAVLAQTAAPATPSTTVAPGTGSTAPTVGSTGGTTGSTIGDTTRTPGTSMGATTGTTGGATGAPGANMGAAGSTTGTSGGSTTSAGSPTPDGALAGANSFTEGQARSRLERDGFTSITGLTKDQDGVWRGKATKGSSSLDVGVDYKGNITTR